MRTYLCVLSSSPSSSSLQYIPKYIFKAKNIHISTNIEKSIMKNIREEVEEEYFFLTIIR